MGSIVVQRTVSADEDELLDEFTDFAVSNGLQVRRQHDGDGLLFVRRKGAEVEGRKLFRSGDSLNVVLERHGVDTTVVMTAHMQGLHRRGEEWRQRRLIRGGLISAGFVALGIVGLTHGISTGDFFLLGAGAITARRTVRRVQHEPQDRAEFEHDVADALHELCDRLQALD
jgi:hypothetical protein